MPKLDAMELKIRVLDCIAKNPNYGFMNLLTVTKKPKATLAKILNQLISEGLLEKRLPEKLGRKHKALYRPTLKGIKYLQERGAILSLIEELNALATIPFEGAAPVSVTFYMGEAGLTSILIRMQNKIAEKLFEKLGGKQTLSYYRQNGEVPAERVAVFTRLTQALNTVVVKQAVNGLGPMVVAGNGAVTALPEDLDEPLAQLIQTPEGLEFLKAMVKMYRNLKAGKANGLKLPLDPSLIHRLRQLLE